MNYVQNVQQNYVQKHLSFADPGASGQKLRRWFVYPSGNSIPRTENDREARTRFTTQNAHCKALRNELSRGHVEVPGVVETGNVFWKMCTLSSSFAQKLWDQ